MPIILVGKPVVKGTRLYVEDLIEQLANGWSAADLLDSYPGLVRADRQACYAYVAETLRDVRDHPIPAEVMRFLGPEVEGLLDNQPDKEQGHAY